MKLNFEQYETTELSHTEMVETTGGFWWLILIGAIIYVADHWND
ncbi:hypothetical protein [Flectobacillus major]|nr:hypothetical protein [Flectobacillus major]